MRQAAYPSIEEARKSAEAREGDLREAVQMGLEMKRDLERKKYAQQAVKTKAALETQLAAYRKALEFYADPQNYDDTPPYDGDPECFTPKAIPVVRQDDGAVFFDCGDIARSALGANL